MATKFGLVVTFYEGLPFINSHYQSAYGHQIWQDGYMPGVAPAHKVIQPFRHVVLPDHMKN